MTSQVKWSVKCLANNREAMSIILGSMSVLGGKKGQSSVRRFPFMGPKSINQCHVQSVIDFKTYYFKFIIFLCEIFVVVCFKNNNKKKQTK